MELTSTMMRSPFSLGRSVSIDRAADLLSCSRRTIYNRIREGRLRTLRTLGGSQRVLVESLQEAGFRLSGPSSQEPPHHPPQDRSGPRY